MTDYCSVALPEDKYLIAKFGNMLDSSCFPQYTDFLDGRQRAVLTAELNAARRSDIRCAAWGGFEGAERGIMALYDSAPPLSEDYPIVCLKISYNAERLTHRDFLGAVLALGLERRKIGDIRVSSCYALMYLHKSVSEAVLAQLLSVGRVSVEVTVSEEAEIETESNFTVIEGTVASMRLDSVIALAFSVSREKAQKIIRSSDISVNFRPVNSPSYSVCCGDIFSVRGFGRFSIGEDAYTTKKGKLRIKINKFV